jgi:hypothetical protein
METGWGLLGDQWNPRKGRVGRVLWLFWGFLCGRPHLCCLRIKGLVPVSKYWMYQSHVGDMGLISPVAGHPQVVGLSLLLQWLSWERNWGESCGPLSRAERGSREHFFSGVVVYVQPYRWLMKGCHEWGPPTRSVRRAYVDWHGKRTCRVGQVFPCRVYIDSSHCDSQIWVTACSRLSSTNLQD